MKGAGEVHRVPNVQGRPALPGTRASGKMIAGVTSLALVATACAAFGVHQHDAAWLADFFLISVVVLAIALADDATKRKVAAVLLLIVGALALGARGCAGCFVVMIGEPTQYQADRGAWFAWGVFPVVLLASVMPLWRLSRSLPDALLPRLHLRVDAAIGTATLALAALFSLRAVEGEGVVAQASRVFAAASLLGGLSWAIAGVVRIWRVHRLYRRAAHADAGLELRPVASGDDPLPALVCADDASVIVWSATQPDPDYRRAGADAKRIARAPDARDGLPGPYRSMARAPLLLAPLWLGLAFIHGQQAADPNHPPPAIAQSFRHHPIERLREDPLELPGVSLWQLERGAFLAAYDHGDGRVIKEVEELLPRYPPGSIEETAARLAALRHNCRVVAHGMTIRSADGRVEDAHPPRLVGHELRYFCRSRFPGGFEAAHEEVIAPLRLAR